MNRIVYMCLKNIPRIPGAWFKLCKYAKNPDNYTREEMADHIRYIMKLAVKSGNINLKVTGTEKFPKEDGFMLYGNHQGMFDAVAMLAAIDRPVAAVFKKELKDIPFVKQIVACTGSYAMDREDVRQSMEVIMNTAKDVAEKKRNFIIFPEGTRSKNGNVMGEFHAGSFKSAQKAKCPIVPFVFIDSFHVLDKDGTEPMDVQLHFLEPIPYEEYKPLKTVELAAMVKDRIQKVIDANT
ncbi:MAG: 1-acyl-sn-glycerol-3-phosphate acyltransferase [Lachnoclostridium sp.]|nr:1-acyl-sn-glycerol-3-phosphate acyltransferase [Lachnoclostridium sp.]